MRVAGHKTVNMSMLLLILVVSVCSREWRFKDANPFTPFLLERGFKQVQGFYVKASTRYQYHLVRDDYMSWIHCYKVIGGERVTLQTFGHNLKMAFDEEEWVRTFARHNYEL